ncbi:MAG: cell division protein SepF [Anaerovoracaceae bacterium]|jgi:cell division inhibitor SepF
MGDGFFSKLKLLVGIEEIEEDELEEDGEDFVSERKSVETRSIHNLQHETRENKDTRVLPMAGRATSANQFKMVVIEPKAFDECPKLVDSLKAKKPIIINLEKIESDMARKIFDFLSGATYALNGNVQKVANNIFIFAPENVDVTAHIDPQNTNHTDGVKNPWR